MGRFNDSPPTKGFDDDTTRAPVHIRIQGDSVPKTFQRIQLSHGIGTYFMYLRNTIDYKY